jgi:hypothetical protein
MGSMGGTALRQMLEDTMVAEICKKNNLLCLGKNVTKVNGVLKQLYNWWVITDQCALTDEQINCIVNDVVATCKYAKPRKL